MILTLTLTEIFSHTTIMFKFQVDWPIIFGVIIYAGTQTDTHKDGHEYSIVVVDTWQLL